MPADNRPIVAKLMNDALSAVAHPGQTLVSVCDMLKAKSGRKLPAGRRKLTINEATKAAMVVTQIIDRLGLAPSDVCRSAGVASDPKNYFIFHLTRAERDAGHPKPGRRLSRSLPHYLKLIIAAAAIAKNDQTPLLDELAEAVKEFLEPFVPFARRDEFEELAENLREIGLHFSKPRKASDGTVVDLGRLWTACGNRALEFSPTTMALEYAGDAPESTWHLTLPRLFLFPRVVGEVEVDCRVNDGSSVWDQTFESLKHRSQSIGKISAKLCYVIHLAVMPAGRHRGKAKAVFLFESWTALPLGPRSKRQTAWGSPAYEIWCPGFPFSSTRGEDDQGKFDVIACGAAEPKCPEFRNWLDSAGDELEDPRIDGEGPRVVEINAEIVDLMFRHESTPGGWDFVGRWADKSALQPFAEMPGGVPSGRLLDRFNDALYRDDGNSLDRQLLREAAPMANALDVFLETSSDEITRRKASFMRRMRS